MTLSWKKSLAVLVAAAVAAGVAAFSFRADIALALMKRRIAQGLAADPLPALPDGLHVGLCGAGSPAQAAGRGNLAVIFHDIVTYHTTPEQAAGIAQRAGARYLLLDHIVPPLPSAVLEGPFLGEARGAYAGPIRVGQDGDFVSMPAGAKAITVINLLR